MDIRAATETDAPGVAEVQVAAWKAAYRGLMPDSLLDALSLVEREEIWQRVIAQQKFRLVVAEQGRKIIGFVNYGPCRDPDAVPGFAGEILAIYVDPEHWHKGIGQELLATALSGLESAGFKEAVLWVLDSNSLARIFYERAGFAFDGAAKSEMVGDNATLRDVRYRRPL
jgi:ribosomal protein S18 acetylase RimI-like enzyme